ncbi:hypothetical protein WA158_003718 [Blastocystis sp. Blastoise]
MSDTNSNETESNSTNYVPYITPAQRKRKLAEEAKGRLKKYKEAEVVKEDADSDLSEEDLGKVQDSETLLDVATKLQIEESLDPEAQKKKLEAQEESIINQLRSMQNKSLANLSERAKGIIYTNPMKTSWTPPHKILDQPQEVFDSLREKYKIDVDGDDIPPVIKRFKDMKLPEPILKALEAKGIMKPTPIQIQALPAILSGRDIIGISYTGSGKTVVFTLPLILLALEYERKLPFLGGEGPVGIILSPSRELASQTFEVINHFTKYLTDGGFETIRSVLCIGGEDRREQLNQIKKGCHIIVATSGRLIDFVERGQINLDSCVYLCLDEADRMLDKGFDEDMQRLLIHFNHQRQTLLFSATFPKQFIEFAHSSLVKPLIINVGRAGAANLDIYLVDESSKQRFIVQECLNKTKPPCLIFCRSQQSVDSLYEYLLLKGIDAVASHGGKSQEERNESIQAFKTGKADVLIATDVAAKGLDFPVVRHVINYDMPDEIETYVHRIGRTGRRGQSGVATTLLTGSEIGDLNNPPTIILDLKHLLKEANQYIPPTLQKCRDPDDIVVLDKDNKDVHSKGCAWCGGLGHKALECPKLLAQKKDMIRKRDYISFGSGGY